MFEARLTQGTILKKVFDAIKELCTDVNIDCNESGMGMQAMDSSHVALVSMTLRDTAFDHYRCDRAMSLGMNVNSVSKILKICGNDDVVTMKAEDEGDNIQFTFENNEQDRISDFELKLMDIDSEHLGIPETDYKVMMKLPSSEFQKIVRDMSNFGDTMTVACTKEGVKFTVSGDIGTGNVMLKPKSDSTNEDENVTVDVSEPVTLAFALRYFQYFVKATPLNGFVQIQMSPDVPLVIEYPLGNPDTGFLRFYLAPKIDE
eukprot:GDKI01045336.1.p1 GENE.GDKI01045336.1~~GDKI01045336.1.p1  ORF type:complete len:271 (+),score=100.59 GDKI01045336.1:35-814(+)